MMVEQFAAGSTGHNVRWKMHHNDNHHRVKHLPIICVLALSSLATPAATVVLNEVPIPTEVMGTRAPGAGALTLRLSGDSFDRCPMPKEMLAIMFPALSESAPLPYSHPLRHPNPNVVTIPISMWPDGGLYIHQVVRYILGSEAEAAAARQLLQAANFGHTGKHYLLCSDSKAVADGKAFIRAKDAVEYLLNDHVDSVLYLTHETSFPTAIPDDLKHSGLSVHVLDGHKLNHDGKLNHYADHV